MIESHLKEKSYNRICDAIHGRVSRWTAISFQLNKI